MSALADALLRPRAVALVGASGDPRKNTGRPQRYLARHGYAGRVLPVNPGRDEVQGLVAYPSVAALPGPVDHALVMVPRDQVEGVVRECAEVGIGVASIYTDGFGDAGPEGREREARLVALAASLGVRLLGPNSMGLINVHTGLALSVNAALDAERLVPGGTSLISQSGTVLGTVLSRGQARGFGFSKLVSVGNEADIGVGEMVDLLVDDHETTCIVMFLEGIRSPQRLAAAARRAHAAGKPVVVYKLGHSEVGQVLARSHSGAITGGAASASAFFRAHGIVEVTTLEALIEIPPLLTGQRPPAGRRVSVVTTTGGGAAAVVDRLGADDVELVPAPPALAAHLETLGVPSGKGPLVDLTMAGTRPGVYGAALAGLMTDAPCDAIVAVVGSSGQFHPEVAVEPIRIVARSKPLAVFIAPQADASLALLAAAGIAGFRTPESCADAVRAYLDWRAPVGRAPERPLDTPALTEVLAGAEGPTLSEAASGRLFDLLCVPRPRSVVLAPGQVPPGDLDYPVVVKVLSADVAHKTEVGGVVLGVPDAAALADARQRIHRSVQAALPDARIEGCVVQPMCRGLAEAIVGYRHDPEVGPLVTLGVGGVLAEVYRDAAVRVAPVDRAEARAMIEEVRGLAPIRGYRGLPRGDLDALADAVAAVSALAVLDGQPVAEAEINPLLVMPEGEGVIALDALVVGRRADSTA
ncbi:MAG: acetate--CoA ligase family protein [Ectothiorhodospiraceae bacterium]|nr:acetate--CoA ligase family protein [Ectothiorhodospiraceae bacterium]